MMKEREWDVCGMKLVVKQDGLEEEANEVEAREDWKDEAGQEELDDAEIQGVQEKPLFVKQLQAEELQEPGANSSGELDFPSSRVCRVGIDCCQKVHCQ